MDLLLRDVFHNDASIFVDTICWSSVQQISKARSDRFLDVWLKRERERDPIVFLWLIARLMTLKISKYFKRILNPSLVIKVQRCMYLIAEWSEAFFIESLHHLRLLYVQGLKRNIASSCMLNYLTRCAFQCTYVLNAAGTNRTQPTM